MLKNNCGGSPKAADRGPRDRGSALVMAAIVSVIVFALGGVLFSFADRQASASNSDRQRQQAIDAASAGLVDAASKLTTGSAPGSYPGTYDSSGSSYQVTVTPVAGQPFRKMLTSVGSSSSAKRTMQQVVEMVPVGFTFGFFTQGTVNSANWTVLGKAYIGGDLNLPSQAKTLTGDIYVAGNVDGGKANLVGSLYANGNVKIASVDSVNDVAAGGTLDIYSGGRCPNPPVKGTCQPPNLRPLPVALQTLPSFPWPNTSYPLGSFKQYATTAAFLADPLRKNEGVFYFPGDVDLSDLGSLTGDMTIIAGTPALGAASGNITLPKTITKVGTATMQISVISTSGGSIFLPNNFDDKNVPMLAFTTGPFTPVKTNSNSVTFLGALYTGSFDAHANVSITYPLEGVKSLGFDWSLANPQLFTIRHISTREINTP
jgi:hypothetical protein